MDKIVQSAVTADAARSEAAANPQTVADADAGQCEPADRRLGQRPGESTVKLGPKVIRPIFDRWYNGAARTLRSRQDDVVGALQVKPFVFVERLQLLDSIAFLFRHQILVEFVQIVDCARRPTL